MANSFLYQAQQYPFIQWVSRFIFRPRHAEMGKVVLTQRRIFILPTRAGLAFAAVLLLLLLTSINYQLSLGFAFTFLLAASAVAGILHTFRNLVKLEIHPGKATSVFAGDWTQFQFDLVNPHTHDCYAIAISTQGQQASQFIDIPSHQRITVELSIPSIQRGWLILPRVTWETVFPLGLWRAWAYWYPAMHCLVYPAPEVELHPFPGQYGGQSQGINLSKGEEDFSAIRPFINGDSLHHLAWKAIARQANDTLLSKHFDRSGQSILWLDWFDLPEYLETEHKLSRLTRWLIEADTRQLAYGLRLPNLEIQPGQGQMHKANCLRALALFGH